MAGLPGWGENGAVRDCRAASARGDPSDAQIRTMLQHLIESRFGLSFHLEKRELSVYAIGVGKRGAGGIKMVKNTSSGPRTGLTDCYDFTLDWRVDEFQFPNAAMRCRICLGRFRINLA
jgi:hypothetical protein